MVNILLRVIEQFLKKKKIIHVAVVQFGEIKEKI